MENKIYRVLTDTDKKALKAYAEYYDLSPEEAASKEYLDEFIAECFHYDERTGQMELNDAHQLPFAEAQHQKGGWSKYTWDGQTVSVPNY